MEMPTVGSPRCMQSASSTITETETPCICMRVSTHSKSTNSYTLTQFFSILWSTGTSTSLWRPGALVPPQVILHSDVWKLFVTQVAGVLLNKLGDRGTQRGLPLPKGYLKIEKGRWTSHHHASTKLEMLTGLARVWGRDAEHRQLHTWDFSCQHPLLAEIHAAMVQIPQVPS